MNKSLAWPIFLSVVTLLVVVFSSLLTIDLYRYYQLKCYCPVEHLEAEVKKLGPNKFCLELDFLYQVNKNKFSRHEDLKHKVYKNAWLAHQRVEEIKESQVEVWYNPHKPHMGVIERQFPLKRLVYTLILFMIFLYFSILGRFMLKRLS